MLRFARRGVSGLALPTNGSITANGRLVTVTGTSPDPGGSSYYAGPVLGFITPTVYAAPTAQGTGSGSSEANAAPLVNVLASVTASDRVGCIAGVYSKASGGSRFTPAWTTTNNGTAANPIIVVAKYSAIDLGGAVANGQWTQTMVNNVFANANRCELRHTGTFGSSGTGSPALGSSGKNYVYFIGFAVDETNANATADTGTSVIVGGTNCMIARCVFQGRPVDTAWSGDNHPGVRVESTTSPMVYDNVVTGFRYFNTNQNGGHNHCGIQRYECVGTDIQHNFCFTNNTNIYLKDQDIAAGETVHQNYCMNPEDSGSNIEILNTNEGSSSSITVASQNLCVNTINNAVGLMGQSEGRNLKWRNNTVIGIFNGGGSAGFVGHYQDTGGEVNDNIFYCSSGTMMLDQQFRTTTVIPSNYNRFFSSGTETFRYNGTTRTGLAAWRSATGQDLNSSVGDPLFVSIAGSDFKLSGSSPCLTGSSSGGAQGCYITGSETIGPRYAP